VFDVDVFVIWGCRMPFCVFDFRNLLFFIFLVIFILFNYINIFCVVCTCLWLYLFIVFTSLVIFYFIILLSLCIFGFYAESQYIRVISRTTYWVCKFLHIHW